MAACCLYWCWHTAQPQTVLPRAQGWQAWTATLIAAGSSNLFKLNFSHLTLTPQQVQQGLWLPTALFALLVPES